MSMILLEGCGHFSWSHKSRRVQAERFVIGEEKTGSLMD